MDKEKKRGRYGRIYKQLQELVPKSDDTLAQMATMVAVLYHKMDYYFWCGFYRRYENGNKLIVGPYQGPAACQVLEGGGVCLESVRQQQTVIVPDVEKFPGHIACDSRSKSEIVVPLKNDSGEVIAVLDIDSKELDSFDEADREELEKIIELIQR